jgi:outer membrane autotransporter protein
MNVSGNNQTLLELGTGIKLGWIFGESDGSIIKPQLRAGYRYALVDDRIEDTAAFTGGGGAFTTQGPDPARSSVNLGTSVRYYTPTNWNLTASYDFDWKSGYTSNAGLVKAGYRF